MSWKPQPADVCPGCKKSVYANEAKLAAGQKWHTLCFKCATCKKLLESTNVTEHDGSLYCHSCHGKKFGPKGYGYGLGAGTLTNTGGASTVEQRTGVRQEPSVVTGSKVEGGCPRCGKRVYNAEKRVAIGMNWHSSCFTCAKCNKTLDSKNLTNKECEIYCNGCYGKLFGPKGIGYGIGAGTLQT